MGRASPARLAGIGDRLRPTPVPPESVSPILSRPRKPLLASFEVWGIVGGKPQKRQKTLGLGRNGEGGIRTHGTQSLDTAELKADLCRGYRSTQREVDGLAPRETVLARVR